MPPVSVFLVDVIIGSQQGHSGIQISQRLSFLQTRMTEKLSAMWLGPFPDMLPKNVLLISCLLTLAMHTQWILRTAMCDSYRWCFPTSAVLTSPKRTLNTFSIELYLTHRPQWSPGQPNNPACHKPLQQAHLLHRNPLHGTRPTEPL